MRTVALAISKGSICEALLRPAKEREETVQTLARTEKHIRRQCYETTLQLGRREMGSKDAYGVSSGFLVVTSPCRRALGARAVCTVDHPSASLVFGSGPLSLITPRDREQFVHWARFLCSRGAANRGLGDKLAISLRSWSIFVPLVQHDMSATVTRLPRWAQP